MPDAWWHDDSPSCDRLCSAQLVPKSAVVCGKSVLRSFRGSSSDIHVMGTGQGPVERWSK